MKFTIATLSLTIMPFLHACPFNQLGGENPHLDNRELAEATAVSILHHIGSRDLQERFIGSVQDAITDASREILDLMQADPRLGPKFVRLAFHDCVGAS